jgi:D-glycero-D-manno-heptose 1,7-bisphosphate phosphatase
VNVNRALFLDRDGTLILDKHHLADPAGVELVPGTVEALRLARAAGFRFFLHSNQSGVGRGYHTLDDVHRVTDRMLELLALPAPVFDAVCIAPERPDQPSLYRKPSPRFIQEMTARHALDPAQCWMIGDRADDALTGLNAGIAAVMVETGKPIDLAKIPVESRSRVAIFPTLLDFVRTIV